MAEQDKREQILLGALQVFSEKGYHKASIKDIAKAAGIKSSALIYHYFEDKKALLQAILQEKTPFGEVYELLENMPTEILAIPPEMLFSQIARRIFSILDNEQLVATVRLFFSEAMRMDEVGDSIQEPQKLILQFLSDYLSHHIQTGYLRQHNTSAAARAFVGMLLAYVMGTAIFSGVRVNMPEREVYIKEIVEIFLQGLKDR